MILNYFFNARARVFLIKNSVNSEEYEKTKKKKERRRLNNKIKTLNSKEKK